MHVVVAILWMCMHGSTCLRMFVMWSACACMALLAWVCLSSGLPVHASSSRGGVVLERSCGLPINSGTLFLIPFIPLHLSFKCWELKQEKKSEMPPYH